VESPALRTACPSWFALSDCRSSVAWWRSRPERLVGGEEMNWKRIIGWGIVLGLAFLLGVGMASATPSHSAPGADRVTPSPTPFPDPTRGGVGVWQ